MIQEVQAATPHGEFVQAVVESLGVLWTPRAVLSDLPRGIEYHL